VCAYDSQAAGDRGTNLKREDARVAAAMFERRERHKK